MCIFLWKDRYFKIRDVFPLIDRPFAGFTLLKSPCNIALYLNNYYEDLTKCERPRWNDMSEIQTSLQWKQIKCKDLEGYYPYHPTCTPSINHENTLQRKYTTWFIWLPSVSRLP